MARNDQIVRILTVAQALMRSRRGVPLRALAERHGYRLRTLYRDVQALDAAGFPVVKEKDRFRIAAEATAAPFGVDPDELLALFIARRHAAGWEGTSVQRALDRLWGKLTTRGGASGALLPAGISPLSARVPFAHDYAAHARHVATFERAIRERVAVSCRYRALSGEITARVIEPGQLHWDGGLETLYLIAWCRLRRAVRVFATQRFLMVSLTRSAFRPRADATSEALRDAFRVWRDEHASRVRLRFAPAAAAEIAERRWHRRQRLTRREDGGVELAFEVAGLTEVERWVLGFGGDVVVLEPRELAERVRAAHAAGAGRYASRRPRAVWSAVK